jgi:steroid delta-isomerase-like uncharacterized protein
MADLISIAREDVEAFNDGDWERMSSGWAPDCVYEELATKRRIEGTDALVETNKSWRAAFPDAHGTITNALESGDTVTLEITWEGTQSGPLQTEEGEIPPSNKRVEVKAVQVMRMEGDKIKEIRHYFDMLGMLEQIGAVQTGEPARAG